MKLGVCGGRTGKVLIRAARVLDSVRAACGSESLEIGHGTAPGYDQAADAWAGVHKLPCTRIPVNNALDGDEDDAPKRRNRRILMWLLDTRQEAALLAFPGGPGSRDMAQIAHDAGVTVFDVEIDGDEFFVWTWPHRDERGKVAKLLCSGTF